MNTVARVTISVPTDLLQQLDHKLAKPGETRSAVVRRVLEEALRRAEEQREIERYIQGYREQPQTEEEFGWSDHATQQGLAQAPWK